MRKLNKRYEMELKSVKAQKACPCSVAACGSCGTNATLSQSRINKYYSQHKSGQYKLF